MKLTYLIIALCLLLSSCNEEKKTEPNTAETKTPATATRGRKWAIMLQTQIDSATYANEYINAHAKAIAYRSVTDSLLANRMLKGIVTFGNYRNGRLTASDSGVVVMAVKPKSGKVVVLEKDMDIYFKAYYPGLNLLECTRAGYEKSQCYNLLSGATGDEAGRPDAVFPSVDGAVRVNGFKKYGDCYNYFIEKWNGNKYVKVLDGFADIHREGQFPCYIGDAFWKDHYTLYFCRSMERVRTYYIVKLSAL